MFTSPHGVRQAEEADTIKRSCEADLAKALPALAGAIKALNSLSKGDIGEVKAMKKPPPAVKMVMEACCMMFGIKAVKVFKDKRKTLSLTTGREHPNDQLFLPYFLCKAESIRLALCTHELL